ncbi:MAG: hypothetical protein QXQ79_00855 [Candidatus Nanoarchaeia archaeon]
MKAGQTNIIGVLMTVAIAIIVTAITIAWAIPLIENTKDFAELKNLENKFIELNEAIKYAAAYQTSVSVPIELNKGYITLKDNRTILYSGQLALKTPVPQKALIGDLNNLNKIGILGKDDFAILIEQGSLEIYLTYIPLKDSTNKTHQIFLSPGAMPGAGKGRHVLIVSFKESKSGLNSTNTTIIFDVK